MLNTAFAPWPSFSPEEVEAVARVLASNRVNYWTGDECRRFEDEFAQWCGARHAVALANGTLALDVALKALGIGPGDEVVVTPRTFLASVSCVVNAGAVPVFADVEPDSGNLSARTIEAVLTPRTRAVVCVHLAGWPCDMDPIMALAQQRGLKVIEDCAQAHGARYKGRHVGTMGDVGAWSFCQDKIMTTGGEGGMVTTQSRELWGRMWSYKDHGKSWEAVYERQHPPGFRWLHESFGTNWRMLEMQAVIGRIQLRRMAEWTAARSANMQRIQQACSPYAAVQVPRFRCGASCPASPADLKGRAASSAVCAASGLVASKPSAGGCQHAGYKCYVQVRPERLAPGWSRDRIAAELMQRGVPAYQGSCSEVYLEKAFDGTGWRPAEPLPNARRLGETSLMFLVHPTLTEANLQATTQALHEVLALASH